MPTERAEELANGAAVGNGRFAVMGTLGWGSQGRTYEAIDKSTGTVVALKRFSVRGASSWKDVELAEREASVLSGLEHPLLPKYLAHFEENGALYLAMERVEGPTLKQLREGRKFSQSEVVAFLNDAALTLAYLHSRAPAVIHRDIKPANVIRRPDGRYALVDFGSVAHVFKPEGGSTVVGTFGYMAPEQFQGRAMPASDLYSVAATALAMLTGVDPEKLPHKGLGIDVPTCLGPEVDPRLRDLLTDGATPTATRSPPNGRRITRRRVGRPSRPSRPRFMKRLSRCSRPETRRTLPRRWILLNVTASQSIGGSTHAQLRYMRAWQIYMNPMPASRKTSTSLAMTSRRSCPQQFARTPNGSAQHQARKRRVKA